MERKEAIRGAYRMTGGNSFNDGMITCSTLSGKAVCRLVVGNERSPLDRQCPVFRSISPASCWKCRWEKGF